jgi:hydroxypyruvate isomerase
MVWTLEGSIEDRMKAAALAGIQSIELFREPTQWSAAEVAGVKRTARSFRLGIDTMGANPNWNTEPVSMVDPAHRPGFLGGLEKSIGIATELGIPYLIVMAGLTQTGRSREDQWTTLADNCKRAADLAAKADLKLIIEPLNNTDHPGVFLSTCRDGLRLVKEVDHPHLRLLFDIYHEQVETGNVIDTIKEAAEYTEVFHVADNPGRHEPGTGEIYYPNVYQAIKETGYAGYIAMEYRPTAAAVKSLKASVDQMRTALG